jgi:type II secretory pathway component PulM
MFMNRLRLLEGSATLHWDGRALHGTAASRGVVVTVPARFVSFRSEDLPPAAGPALKAAARMRAERAFSPLGPVAVEALLPRAEQGRCQALLMALPKSTCDAIRQAAVSQGHVVNAIRVAELLVDIPPGGVVQVSGEACLIGLLHGQVRGIAALGPVGAPGFAALLQRERLRLGIAEDAPGAPAPGAELDFLHPTLLAPPALLSRPGVRLALLAAGIVLVSAAALGLVVNDAIAARADAQAEAARLRPLAAALAARRSDLKEVAPWLDARPSLAPGLHALAKALPDGNSDDQVRLVRVRQVDGEDTVVEGSAGDRAQMVAYLERLRRDPRVAFAEIRSSRSPSKESRAVVFELVMRLGEGSGGPEVLQSGRPSDTAPTPEPTTTVPAATGTSKAVPTDVGSTSGLPHRGERGLHAEA